jgi:RNA binding exosome subunit
VVALQAQVIQTVEISTIAHATDDLEKVQGALNSLLPETLKVHQIFTRKYLEGHYGNPIVTFEARLTKSADVAEFTEHFLPMVPRNDRLRILRDIDLYSDEDGNLYFRINKQQAFLGQLQLGDEDPIRIRLKFSKLQGEVGDLMRKFLESE